VDKAFLSFVGGKVSIEHQFESEGGTVVAIAYFVAAIYAGMLERAR